MTTQSPGIARTTPISLTPAQYRAWRAAYEAECPGLRSRPLDPACVRHRNRARRLWAFLHQPYRKDRRR